MALPDTETSTDDDPFSDLDVDADEILGTHRYDVLYTEEKAREQTPVNVLTNERMCETPTKAEAKAFADRQDSANDAPYIAKVRGTESMAETGGKPYSACVFCHYRHTGGMDRHMAFLQAWNSDQFDVTVDTDYESGLLTITVESSHEGSGTPGEN